MALTNRLNYATVHGVFRSGLHAPAKHAKVAYWATKYGVDKPLTWMSDKTLLHFAAEFGWSDELHNWSRIKDVRIDQRANSVTPFLAAVRAGALEAVKILAGAGADIHARITNECHDSRDGDGNACLVCGKTRLELLNWLIANGVRLDDTTAHGQTVLHQMSWLPEVRQADVMTIVAACPALLNARNNDGETPLHCAWHAGRTELCIALVEAGASPAVLWESGTIGYKTWSPSGLLKYLWNGESDRFRALSTLLAWGMPAPEDGFARAAIDFFAAGKKGIFRELVRSGTVFSEAQSDELFESLLVGIGTFNALDESSLATLLKEGLAPSAKTLRAMIGRIGDDDGYLSVASLVLLMKTPAVDQSVLLSIVWEVIEEEGKKDNVDLEPFARAMVAHGYLPSRQVLGNLRLTLKPETMASIERAFLVRRAHKESAPRTSL